MHCWKTVELILPDSLDAAEVLRHAHALIRITATEAGEFVQEIRVGVGVPHHDGWRKWTASYLTGPPGAFPAW
jgi:hypothetical protein